MQSNATIISGGALATICAAVALVVVSAGAGGEDERAGRARLANLSLTEQEELQRKREAFDDLDQSEQERMRELHVAISTSPDSERLHRVMLQYHEWLKTLTGKERADLLKLSPDERVAEIKRLMEQQRQQRFRDLVRTPLAPEDVRAVFAWLDLYTASHEEELLAMLPENTRERVTRPNVPATMRRKMLLMALSYREADLQLPAPTDEDLTKLNESLSDNAQQALSEVPSREQKLQLVREWVRAAVASRMVPQVSRERLMAFYRDYREKTSDKKRVEELDSMAPDEFYAEVKKLYFRSRGHYWRGRRDGDHHGPPPQGRDGRESGRDPRDSRRDDEHRNGTRGEGDRDRSGPRIGPSPRGDRPPSPPPPSQPAP